MNLQGHPIYPHLLLEYFSNQLAEYIVQNTDNSCSLCVHGACDQKGDQLTCRCGVSQRLTNLLEQFSNRLSEEIEEQFHYLDTMYSFGIFNMNCSDPYLQYQFPNWSQQWYKAVIRLWMDTYQERTEEQ